MQLTSKAVDFIKRYAIGLANSYGVADMKENFAISEPQEIKLRKGLIESSEFLQQITCLDVEQIKGQVVSVGVAALHTGRKKSGRFIRQIGVEGNEYELAETDSCAQLTWALLVTWANAGSEDEFFKLVNAFSSEIFAADMLRIGFNGKSVAANTDPDANPNGEDVNKGWHQIATEYKEGQQIVNVPISLGHDNNADYTSLDQMAADLINTKIPPQFRNDPRLVVLVGTDLVAAEQYRLYGEAKTPTEKLAAQQLSSSIAARLAIVPPFMPAKRMAVTILTNLHLYTQRGTRKRTAEDVQDRKAYENKYWRMEGYALEVPELYAAFDEEAVTIDVSNSVITEKESQEA